MKINKNYEINVSATIDCECFNTAYSTVESSVANGIADIMEKDDDLTSIEYAILGGPLTKLMAATIKVYRPDSLKSLSAALYDLFVNQDSEALDTYQKEISVLPEEFIKYVKELAF